MPAGREYASRALVRAGRIYTASRFKLWSVLITLEIRILAGDLHGLDDLVLALLAARESGTIYESYAAAHAVALGMRTGDPVLVEAFFDPAHLHAAITRRDVELCGLLLNALREVMASRGMSAELSAMIEQCVAADMVDPYFAVQLSAAQFGSLELVSIAREQIARLVDRRRRNGAAAVRSARAAAFEYLKLGCKLMEASAFELAGEIEVARDIYARAGALREATRMSTGQSGKARRAAFASALTLREREVLTLIRKRQTNKQIAATLKISERTVHSLLQLGQKTRRQLPITAVENCHVLSSSQGASDKPPIGSPTFSRIFS